MNYDIGNIIKLSNNDGISKPLTFLFNIKMEEEFIGSCQITIENILLHVGLEDDCGNNFLFKPNKEQPDVDKCCDGLGLDEEIEVKLEPQDFGDIGTFDNENINNANYEIPSTDSRSCNSIGQDFGMYNSVQRDRVDPGNNRKSDSRVDIPSSDYKIVYPIGQLGKKFESPPSVDIEQELGGSTDFAPLNGCGINLNRRRR